MEMSLYLASPAPPMGGARVDLSPRSPQAGRPHRYSRFRIQTSVNQPQMGGR